MRRTISYLIENEDIPGTVSQYLKRRGYSSRSLTQLKKLPAGLTVDGLPARACRALRPGELLTVTIEEEAVSQNILPAELPLTIVYEDEDLLVVNKPAGMPIHPSANNRDNSLGNALAWYYREQGLPFVFRCVNRLDRDTSGLTLVAKHIVSAGILSSMAAGRRIEREYAAIVRGSVSPASGVIRAPLGRRPGSVIERTVDFENGEEAVTHYRVTAEKNGHSLLSLRLETGRTHQIRIHLKYLGYPLIGDYLYHPDMEWIGRQALHSARLAFPHPITGAPLEFTAPLPEDMRRVLEPDATPQGREILRRG